MKKVFKFTLAALAATVLASCSTDDFSSIGTEKGQLKKGDLIVEVEGMKNPLMTRTVYTPETQLFWQDKDKVYTYDGALLNYDVYEYDLYEGYFKQNFKQNNNVPAEKVEYATYLGDCDPKHNWEVSNGETVLKAEIPYNVTWDSEEIENLEGKRDTAYISKLPMWGTAGIYTEGELKGRVHTKLNYLTAILKIDLKNVPTNVKSLYVRGWDNAAMNRPSCMTGVYTALIAKEGTVYDGEKGTKIAALDPASADFSKENADDKNYIIIDLYSDTHRTKDPIVLIPLMPGDYAKLQVVASENPAKTEAASGSRQQLTKDVNNEINTIITNATKANATEKAKNLVLFNGEKKGVTRGVMYTTGAEYNIEGETVNSVQAALTDKIMKSKTVDVELTTSGIMQVGGMNGETLTIPAETQLKNIDLNLAGWTWNPKEAYKNKQILTIDIEEGATLENLTLRVGQNVQTEGVEGILEHLYINLPETNVTILGAGFSDIELGNLYEVYTTTGNAGNRFVRNGLVVKSLTVGTDDNNGEYTTVKAVSVNDATTGPITIGKKVSVTGKTVTGPNEYTYGLYGLTLEKGTAVKNIVVNGSVAGSVDATVENTILTADNAITVKVGDGATIVNELRTSQASLDELKNVTINTIRALNAESIEVTGESTVKYIYAKAGDVKIALTGYAKAATTRNVYSRTVTKVELWDGHTLDLQGGYVTTVEAKKQVGNATQNTGVITIKNEEIKGEATAINTLTYGGMPTETAGVVTYNITASKWGGKKAELYVNPVNIYTPSQLVTLTGGFDNTLGNNYYLYCSPDMTEGTFEGVNNLQKNFFGNGNKISNLKVEKPATATDKSTVGLFCKVTGIPDGNEKDSLVISNLTIDKANVTAYGAKAGVLFGYGKNGISVENVTISGGHVKAVETTTAGKGNADDWNVGGVAGQYESTCDQDTLYLKNVTVSGTTIEGRYHLGGLVGETMNTVGKTVKVLAGTTFTVGNRMKTPNINDLVKGGFESDMNAGTVGKYFGFVGNKDAGFVSKVNLEDASETVGAGYNRESLGFKNRWAEKDLSGKTEETSHYWYGSTDGLVGEVNYDKGDASTDYQTISYEYDIFRVNLETYGMVEGTHDSSRDDTIWSPVSSTGWIVFALQERPEGSSTKDRVPYINTYIRWNK